MYWSLEIFLVGILYLLFYLGIMWIRFRIYVYLLKKKSKWEIFIDEIELV